jgi:probable F420-dependent oxidoreductase
MRLGITVPIDGIPIADAVVPLARLAEDLGYTDAWSAEVSSTDGLTPLAALAVTTKKLRLGTAILPAFSRPPALMAMEAASLQALSNGRFILGIGTSSSIIVGGWMGGRFELPLTRIKETVAALRQVFAGKKLDLEGQTVRSKGFRLTADPGSPVPIYVAALGPRMLRLAGEVADGVILYLFTPEGAREAIMQVRDSARFAGRDPDAIDVVARIPVAIDQDPEMLKYMLRRLMVTYAMVDVYNASIARQGYGTEANAIAERWKEGDREGAASAVTDEMLDSFYLHGDRESCVAGLQKFRAAGIKTPVLYPVSVAGDPELRLKEIRSCIEAMAEA